MRQRNGADGGLHEGRATNKLADNPDTIHTRRVYSEAATRHGERSIFAEHGNPGQESRANADTGQACQHVHEWGDELPAWKPGQVPQTKWANVSAIADGQRAYSGQYCQSCQAWRGHLGLEPTVEAYVEHLVECFREVKRVLREDGTCWLNLGTTYAGSGKGPTGWNGIGNQEQRQGFASGYLSAKGELVKGGRRNKTEAQAGYKAKDLILIPFLVAEALRADGWYVRSMISWLKRSAMPESVRDRPSTAIEYVILLSKNATYYYDPDAVRSEPSGRNRRNSDWFFESWQGLLLNEDDEPLALVVNPQGLKEAHYASMPPKLVEPMLKASTSERGCCPECGAPWQRVIEQKTFKTWHNHTDDLRVGQRQSDNEFKGGNFYNNYAAPVTTGWQPACEHGHPKPAPCTVLDPFSGAGTTLLVADRLGRNGIGCELSPTYSAELSAQRLIGDSPLFTQLELI